MDLVWFAITPHVPVLSPACKLLPSESPSNASVHGDGASPIGQEASSASKRKASSPHGSCRGPSGGDMHIQTSNQKNRKQNRNHSTEVQT